METNLVPPAPQAPVMAWPKSSQLLKEATAIYKARFQTLIGIYAVPALFIFVISFILGATGVIIETNKNVSFSGGTGAIIAVVAVLLIIYVSVLSFAALIHNIISPEGSAGFGESFKQGQPNVLPLIGTGILTFLAVLGGMILLIVPGIIFSFWFSQVNYVVITEKLSGPAAMKQSKFYVKGNIGQIFMKGFYIGIISAALSIGIGLLAGVLDSMLHTSLASTIVGLAFQIIWTPLAAVYTFLIFRQLKSFKAQTPAV